MVSAEETIQRRKLFVEIWYSDPTALDASQGGNELRIKSPE